MRGGQSWSIDAVIGVLIFLLVIGVFYALLTNNAKEDTTDLKISSETIATKLTDDSKNSIVIDDTISQEKLVELAQKKYLELKKELSVNSEFCVFFKDERGSVINITYEEDGYTYTYVGIGSSKINVSGIPCKEVV